MTSDRIRKLASVHAACRLLDRRQDEFAAWLAKYVTDYSARTWVSRRHEYWAVPMDLVMNGEWKVLSGERDACFLGRVMEDDNAVLSIAPEPTWQERKLAAAAEFTGRMALAAMPLVDFMMRWGERTCPACFSRQLAPFTVSSNECERPSHFCNGCNTIWPPRHSPAATAFACE
jgi:hypothetical protein